MNRTHTPSADDTLYVGIDRHYAGIRHRYLIRFDERSRDSALQTVSRWAANEALGFEWADAIVLAKRIRNI